MRVDQQQEQRTPQQDMESKFRDSLQDVVIVAERLAPYCKDVEELLGMLRLGIESDGQLRLLMGKIKR